MSRLFINAIISSLAYTFMPGLIQAQEELRLPERKRFIDRIEVFAGPNLSFNHGNMFIENYRGEYADDNYVINKRLLKPGYELGIGVYHPFTERISINARVLYEHKGTKNELNNPSNPVNDDSRKITMDNYTYNYLTLNVLPTFFLDHKKVWTFSFGAYYSRIKNVRGYSEIYNTRDFQVDKGSFDGRYFYHLREDGGMDGFSWNPFLTGIETFDYGIVSSASYKIVVNEKHAILIQLKDNLGIKNINRNNPYGLKEKNHSLSLIFSYIYHLPSKS